MATDSAPAVQVFVEPTKGEPQSEAPAPTFYCCWRCKSSNACCGPCRFACTPRRKRVCVAVVVFLCSAAVAIIIAAVYLTWPKQGRAVKITAVSGTSLSTASLSAGGSGRKLLQTPAVLTPASAVPGATECAYAQVSRVPTVNTWQRRPDLAHRTRPTLTPLCVLPPSTPRWTRSA